MPKALPFASELLDLILNGGPDAGVGIAQTELYLSLHTADPGTRGLQDANEVTQAAYVGYTRQPVSRTGSSWSRAVNGEAALLANADWPAAGPGSTGAVITHVGLGCYATGPGRMLYTGPTLDVRPI